MLTFHLFLYFVRVRLCPFAISVLRSIRDPKEENYFFNGIGRAEIVNDLDLIKVSIQCRQGKSRAQQLRVASKIVRFSLEASPCGTEEILHNKLILCAPNNAPDAVKMVVLPFDAHLEQKKMRRNSLSRKFSQQQNAARRWTSFSLRSNQVRIMVDIRNHQKTHFEIRTIGAFVRELETWPRISYYVVNLHKLQRQKHNARKRVSDWVWVWPGLGLNITKTLTYSTNEKWWMLYETIDSLAMGATMGNPIRGYLIV